MLVRIEGFGIVDNADQTSKVIPELFNYLVQETCLNKEEIRVVLKPLPLWRIGRDGHALTELPTF